MAKKRSAWMDGLLQGEQYIRCTNIAAARFYFDTELQQCCNPEFNHGWWDAMEHYAHVHPE